jgi:hypothetical protein
MQRTQMETPVRLESFVTRPADRLWLRLAQRLPARLRYWVVVRAWAEAGGGAVLPERTPSLTVGELVGLLEE